MKVYMKQKFFSLVDQYKLYDANEKLLYYTEGKLFSLSGEMKMYDKNKNLRFTFRHKIVTLLPRVKVIDHLTKEEIVIKKHLTFLHPKLSLTTKNHNYTIKGSVFQYSFDILENNQTIASVRKKILSWADTYELEYDETHSEIILALLIGIDTIIHNDRYNN